MDPTTRSRWQSAGLALASLLVAAGLIAVWLLVPDITPAAPSSAGPGPGTGADAGPAPSGLPAAPGRTPGGSPAASARPTPAPGTPGATRCVRPPTTLRVASFNIHSAFATGHRGLQLGWVAEEIRRARVDVVLLQETDDGRSRTRGVNQPAALAAATGMAYVFGANVIGPGRARYGTTILSRFPVRSSTNTALPRPGRTQQRGLLHAVIDVHGQPVSIYDTHLENTSLTARVEQMRRILPIIEADPLPIVLGGDLNSAPLSPVLDLARTALADTWAEVGSGPGHTHPQHGPHVRIDYVLHRSGTSAQLRAVRARVVPSQVSDHRMVRAVLALTPSEPVCVPVLRGQQRARG